MNNSADNTLRNVNVDDTIRRALAEKDDDQRWHLVSELHRLSTKPVLEAAMALCRATSARERVLGADILAQMTGEGHTSSEPESPFYEERLDALLGLLGDTRVSVVESAAIGLHHMRSVRAVDALVALTGHPSRRVRFAVTFGLLALEDERAIGALIELSHDGWAHVRDWATFGLGTQIDADTSEIRDALADRLADSDYDTKCEAIFGLSRRKDSRALAPLLRDLDGDTIGKLLLEAAQELGDPRLLPALSALQEHWQTNSEPDQWDIALADAISACDGPPTKSGT